MAQKSNPNPKKPVVEKEISEKEIILDAVLHSASEGIVIADQDGKFILWNDAAREIVGMGSQDVDPDKYPAIYGTYKDEECTNLFKAEELPLFRAIRGDVFTNVEMFLKNDHVDFRCILLSGRPYFGKNGKRGGVLMFRDVTDVCKAKQIEQYYKKFYHSVPISFFTTSIKDGTFIRANPYCVRMLGFETFEEMARRIKSTDLYVDLDDRKVLIEELLNNHKVTAHPVHIKLLNGEERWVEVTASLCRCGKFPMCDKGCGACFEGLLFDITKKKKMEDELSQLREARVRAMKDINLAIEEKLKTYQGK